MLRNLKLQIALSFFGLLSIGMFLLAFVLLVLWHNNIVTLQATHLQSLLRSTKESFEATEVECSQLYEMAVTERLLGEEMVSCLVMVRDGKLCDAPQSCGKTKSLEKIMRQTAQSGKEYFSFQKDHLGQYFLGKQSYVAATGLVVGGKTVGALAMSGSIESVNSSIVKGIKIALVYIFVNAFLLTVVGFYRMFKFVIRPLEQVVRLADEYNDKSPVGPFIQPRLNEFSQLAFSLKQMMKRIKADNLELHASVDRLQKLNEELKQARSEVIRAEKLASVGRLSAGLAHEIGNPLAIIQGYLELLAEDDLTVEERQKFSAKAQQELERIQRLIGQLLDFARPMPAATEKVSVNGLIVEVVEFVLLARSLGEDSLKMKLPAEDITLTVDKDALRQVLINCLFNALDATAALKDRERQIRLALSFAQIDGSRPQLVISIEDNGSGIIEEQLALLFDPFFTTKEVGKGTGLGLFVCHILMERLAGTITLHNREAPGAKVRITLPL